MSSEYRWKIAYTRRASEELRNLSKDLQKRIAKKMRFFALADDIFKFSKKLENNKYGNFRFRVGDYRIIFDKIYSKKEISILKIAKRDEVYK